MTGKSLYQTSDKRRQINRRIDFPHARAFFFKHFHLRYTGRFIDPAKFRQPSEASVNGQGPVL
jgi:hypothetical protein